AFDAESFDQILQKQSGQLPARLLGQIDSPDIPKELELVIFKCLQKKPESRFQSAEAFGEALDLVLKERWRELDLSGVQMVGGKSTAARSYKLAWTAALAVLIIGALMAVAFMSISNQRAIKPRAPVVAVDPALEDRIADCRRARSLLDEAKVDVARGNYGQADSLARAALMCIGHQYPDAASSPSMSSDDLEILERIAQIYGNGGKVGTLVPKPMPKIREPCASIILPRDVKSGSPNQQARLYIVLATICSIFGDYSSAADLTYQGVQGQIAAKRPENAREIYREGLILLGPSRASSPAVDYFMNVSEGIIALVEGNKTEARAAVDRATTDVAHLGESRGNERFHLDLPLLAIRQGLHDEVASKRLFDEAEKSAFETADGFSFNMYGTYLERGKGLELFDRLQRTVIDPKLKARAEDDIRRLTVHLHQSQ
ncbi:MAG TPA: hypothetical protein V6D22_22665, partial [Candidatus Obscuribacterales bacterium]